MRKGTIKILSALSLLSKQQFCIESVLHCRQTIIIMMFGILPSPSPKVLG
jgi:hypothetical protein